MSGVLCGAAAHFRFAGVPKTDRGELYMMLIYLALLETAEDKAKFEQLYDRYMKQMYRVAFSVLHNQHDAEDAVHEAFVSLTDCLDGVKEIDSPQTKSLLSMITQRKAIDIYRANQRRKNVPIEDTLNLTPAPSQLQAIEDASDLARAIAMLPDSYREVILLRYDNGFSEREVGQICDLTESNTHKRIERAKKKLRKICDEMGIEFE